MVLRAKDIKIHKTVLAWKQLFIFGEESQVFRTNDYNMMRFYIQGSRTIESIAKKLPKF